MEDEWKKNKTNLKIVFTKKCIKNKVDKSWCKKTNKKKLKMMKQLCKHYSDPAVLHYATHARARTNTTAAGLAQTAE